MRGHIPRSRTQFYEFEYRAVHDDRSPGHLDHPECKFPDFPPPATQKRTQNIITGVIWFGLILLGSLLAVNVVITVLLAVRVDNDGFDSNKPEYALYKNTIFKDCYNRALPTITHDCSAIMARLQETKSDYGFFSKPYLSQSNYLDTNRTAYDWCDIMSCLNGFKIIPSKPRSSAFWPTTLDVWNKSGITFLLAFWQLHKLHRARWRKENTPCKEMEWDTWIILAWDVASFIWWCVGLGRFALAPALHPMPSMLGWVSTWKNSYMIQYHPYGCILRHSPNRLRVAKWTLITLATLQWIGGVYIAINTAKPGLARSSYYPAYECLASQISEAPGVSTCSADQICSKVTMFGSVRFDFPNQFIQGFTSFIGLFAALSGVAIMRGCTIGMFPLIAYMFKGATVAKWRKKASKYDFGFSGSVCMASGGSAIIGAVTVAEALGAFGRDRVGPVVLHWDCNVVHVNVSPWRYYLDVDYALPLRIAKMWFNS
ncbi:uncharacterized protein PGRI_048240 [Penicillium griseofulvum]|uniref:Uncharacterized protein n=1 Tax=Penicillium patulum TaxID=5078 RepID=A0A135LAG9_PENPA|nr:uncharacterized protein PGRI_048240 [Penicillium griseofulvum]KXG45968.1 hypothetical protein PGRI_048240 [Penicillium griseofulvum]